MHHSSRLKFESFVETYMKHDGDLSSTSILDVGARQVKEGAYSYRQALDGLGMKYIGLDLEQGFNVNIVPANPYVWDEIEDESFDYVISGQAFEHNPFMWITTAEIARVLKPGGIAFIIAPSAGGVHRFPYDCWRYFPDSWAALAAVSQLDLIESIREPVTLSETVPGGRWMDSVAIFKKRPFASPSAKEDFYANLAVVVAPFKARRYEVIPAKLNEGPCFQHYKQAAKYFKATQKGAASQRRAAGDAPDAGGQGTAREQRKAAKLAARRAAKNADMAAPAAAKQGTAQEQRKAARQAARKQARANVGAA